MKAIKTLRGSRLKNRKVVSERIPAYRKRDLLHEKDEASLYLLTRLLEKTDELAKVRSWLKTLALYLLPDEFDYFNFQKLSAFCPEDDRLKTYSGVMSAAKTVRDQAQAWKSHQETWWYKLGKLLKAI